MDYLPIFMKIEQQHCLIVGGGTVAARKADLFIKSGAIVTVVAPKLGNEMTFHLAQGKIIWHMNTFSTALVSELPRPSLVISATDDQNVNLAVYKTYHAQDIPVNVADQTEYCDFILPAIVDRSPMTIAISTGGRSPVLARVMKARLETMIPHGFSVLTDLVGRYRQTVKNVISDIDGRKTFWETLLSGLFIDKAVHGNTGEAEALLEAELETIKNNGQSLPQGEVYIIGAGPGDPDLMTFKGLRLLQQADVILYDRLVAPEILEMGRREAERIYVGKKEKWHKMDQKDINQMLVDLARQGKRVARLKGGDPYIFGRGAEEVELLVQHDVPYQVVPGITAAAGCSVYADFPLTHRDYAQSVALITGHQQAGAQGIDYARLAQSGDTMVFYMGIKNAPKIQAGLIAHGLCPDTPAAIIENGTRLNQKVTVTSLAKLSETIQKKSIKPPALLVIGEVIKVRERLQKKSLLDDRVPA
ncbi:MAG: uroporphyrinogen-III C-methyltransferase [Hydrogenovibrio crunogenus]|uniref:Siroheme synthase n=1 Tax=Hydrogenovibrio crunogenus (strain DSM 25203 / XCL-2) TaxID=317025 RepID=CYSG_HYDCU|nr:RecName: Full=Siroheme synthase; Includes: RecName: Full=Uroporphyrinogen-III C-methyltransferase; Short=Urogen III methylase; AltName: Full=SUMT; AltName: Full=Uroporphyrinogen III methylase; Short=UROM; Includes: RecName: Full=Precorrin-2 dehydrogenase; Includes: RecName: Full=Sirohydrochlorin ferrochelatase [Hydrogenovibrio crunogenus XCL-2]MBD3612478.1 uroporphyrinogen-III C-methyltransferase [Hydrogenovibrio crunogenus]